MKTSAGDALKTLKNDLSSGVLRRLYLFHGEETYLKSFYTQKLKQQLIPAGLEAFNLEILAEKNLTFDNLRAAVESLPAMSSHKLVIVRDLDVYKPGADMKPRLDALLGDLPETCVLLLDYDTIAYKPDARMKKTHQLLSEKSLVVAFERQSDSDLAAWLTRRFAALGKGIDRREAEYLIFLCGGLMNNLVGEVEKIAAFCRTDTITRRDIDAVAVPVLDAVVFQLTDALAQNRYDQALRVARELFTQREPPVLLLGALGRQLRGLYLARLSGQMDTIMKGMGLSSYPAQKLLAASRGRSLAWCRRAALLCAECDVALKATGRSPEDLLELFLMKLACFP